MKTKLTLEQIYNAQAAIQKILHTELPAKIAFRLSRLAKVLVDVYGDIETQRVSLVKKLGEHVEGDNYKFTLENKQLFINEFNTFLSDEIELDFEKIPLDAIQAVKLTPIELISLEPFLALQE